MRDPSIRITFRLIPLIFVWSCFLFSSLIKLNGQSLELVDRIYGGLGPISDLAVNISGQRFYLFERVYDSIVVNDRFLQIPSRDPTLGSPYYWGRNYLVISDDDSDVLRRPGGTALLLNDTSIFVATTIVEDTLVTQDTIFINEASGDDGQNLLLIQYDFRGNVLRTKHWSTTSRSYLAINKLASYKNQLFFCGECNTPLI